MTHHASQQVQRALANGDILIIQAPDHHIAMLGDGLRMSLHDVVQGQQTEVLDCLTQRCRQQERERDRERGTQFGVSFAIVGDAASSSLHRTVLVRVLDEQSKLGDAQPNDVDVRAQADGARLNALVQQRHGVGRVHNVGQRSDQLLGETLLQRSQGTKLHDDAAAHVSCCRCAPTRCAARMWRARFVPA